MESMQLASDEDGHGSDTKQRPDDEDRTPRWSYRGVIPISRRQEANEACVGVSRKVTDSCAQGSQKYMVAPYGHPSVALKIAAPTNQNVKKTLHAIPS